MKEVVIKPTYYDKFKCSADKCLYTCCTNWNLDFDDETIEKYASIKDDELSAYILNNISPLTKKATLKKGYCPFLDTDSLCKIQKKCGEAYLCSTCRNFPRTKRTIANITKQDLLISCPEVLKIIKNEKIFTDNYIVEIQDKKCKFLKLDKDNKNYFIELFNILKYIYNQKYNYKKSIFILLNFAEDCQKLINKKTNKNFNTFKEKFNKEYFINLAKKYNPKKDKNITTEFEKILYDTADNKILSKKMYLIKENYKKLNSTDTSIIKLKQKFSKIIDKLFNLKNLLFYIINITIIDGIKHRDFLNVVKFAIVNILFLNLFAITQQDITRKKTNNNLLVLATCLFRGTYHSNFYDNLEEILSNSTFSTKNILDYILTF